MKVDWLHATKSKSEEFHALRLACLSFQLHMEILLCIDEFLSGVALCLDDRNKLATRKKKDSGRPSLSFPFEQIQKWGQRRVDGGAC